MINKFEFQIFLFDIYFFFYFRDYYVKNQNGGFTPFIHDYLIMKSNN